MKDVALVHDYLNQRGGAERVVLELMHMWPEATLHTSLYRPGSTFPEFAGQRIRTSALDRLPVDRRFRALLPLYPAAFRALGRFDERLVVSSSSGWAHGVRTGPDTTHVVYCYAPARWLHATSAYTPSRARRLALAPVLAPLRRWDRRAAARADVYVAIATNVRERIRAAYGIDAELVHPPVDVERFAPRPRGERLLVIARLLPYKRVDLALAAAERLGIGIDVVGDGPERERLRAAAGPGAVLHGRVGEAELVGLLEGCRALVMPGREDFGIVPVEANAAGKPVVAYGAGGALETVRDEHNGTLFAQPTAAALAEAVQRADRLAATPEQLAAHARRFAPEAFRSAMRDVVGRALAASEQQRA